ncbi:serine O-acetyltransferase EpsC [Ralstonia pseudosolanacearum]
MSQDQLPEWFELRGALERMASEGTLLKSVVDRFLNQPQFEGALSILLADQLASARASAAQLLPVIEQAYRDHAELSRLAVSDMRATMERDPATDCLSTVFLFSKGFHALEAYRVAHHYWCAGRQGTALSLSHACSCLLGVDIHPAAKIGAAVMFDHASGIVIGETAEIGDEATLLHGVTLGGNGRHRCDRHPKIGAGTFIGAHASIIGNIRIGKDSIIGAGAVVLADVPDNSVAVGVPAKGKARERKPDAEFQPVLAAAGVADSPSPVFLG